MASRTLAGDATRYDRLDDQDLDQDRDNDRATDINSSTPPLTASSRSTVRRRRPDPRPSPIRAMSLVGLKNLFFRKTVTPIPTRSKSNYGMPSASPSANFTGPFDWRIGSRQPLLRLDDPSNQSLTTLGASEVRPIDSSESDAADLEEQSIDSKMEKASQKKGFRIDARVISDATIGLSDGLTVPFALTAGLSALGNTRVVIYGGFAELIAGAISMGLGGYLGAKSEM